MAKSKTKSKHPPVTQVPVEQRAKALEVAMKSIEKDFGKGSLIRLGDRADMTIEAWSTGILPLDVALGIGGLPKGRIIEIYGAESSGKTTVTLHCIAQCQKDGGTCAFIDAEHALDPVYAKRIGVDIDNLLLSQPDNGEQALEITEALVRSGAVDLIVIDSVAALVPAAEIEGAMGDAAVGLHARLMSKALRKLTGIISRSNCSCIFINQLRDRIGMYAGGTTTTGGRALKFYTSVRMEVKRDGSVGSSSAPQGNGCAVKIVKNKIAPPFQIANFPLYFGTGVDNRDCVIEYACAMGLMKKSGSWYSYEGKNLGQGMEKVKEFFESNPELYAEIETKVRAEYLPESNDGEVAATKAPIPNAKFDEDGDESSEDVLEALDDMDDEDILEDILGLDEL
ncbi:MAG: recombinase RecA [Eubacteriales bacterium]|nr:recombinase RecA [Eubacteriales bacterium]